jgi:hypothetical protein
MLAIRGLICLALALVSAPFARGQCGAWDTRFSASAPGLNGLVYSVTTFDDGSGPALYAGGLFNAAGGVSANGVARWNGAQWSTVGNPGEGPPALALATFDDGSGPALYAGGVFTMVGEVWAPRIARWNGTSWSALTPGGVGPNGGIHAMAVFDDGSGPALYIGGDFTPAGLVVASCIARWNGTSWSALGPPGSGMAVDGLSRVAALAVFDDGSGPALYAAGQFTIAGGVSVANIARWNGTSWSALGAPGSGLSGYVRSLTVFDDGTGPALHAGGDFLWADGVHAPGVARWNGTSWSGLVAPGGGGTDAAVHTLAGFDDGTGPALYAGGAFTMLAGVPAARIAKWNGSSWSALGTPNGTNAVVTSLAVFDGGSGPALCAGGWFTTAGGVPVGRTAQWNGATWSALGSSGHGMDAHSTVAALAVFDDSSGSSLYAGGEFTEAGGVPAQRIARWNGSGWSALGAPGSGMNDSVLAVAVLSGSGLYAGGEFTVAGGVPATFIARWAGGTWSAVGVPGGGTNSHVHCLTEFDDGSGPALYAGGNFTTAGGISTLRIARWNGTSWSALGAPGGGMSSIVSALAVFDDGSGPALYAGGMFNLADGVSANRIARWNGTSWSPLGTGMNSWVDALAVFDDGTGAALYAAGNFTTAGGVTVNRIARWNGTSWSALGSGMNDRVRSLAAFDDVTGPALYVGGIFTTAGGVSAPRLARWNGTSWSTPGAPGVGGHDEVRAFALFDDGTDGDLDLYVGGKFGTVGTIESRSIAQWHSCASAFVPLCFGDGTHVDHGTSCPCGNNGTAGNGCANSAHSTGANLAARGSTTLDSVVLHATRMPATSPCIYLQGDGTADVAFGDGVRCTGGTLVRLRTKTNVGGASSFPDPLDTMTLSQRGGIPVGSGVSRYYQTYYRNASTLFCPPAMFNVTNGVRIVW